MTKVPLLRRIAPAVALLFLSPWVGEYLLGSISIRDLVALPFLVPLYGGGALLIREVVRRTGRGWSTVLLLGAAYGVIEAGLVDQSLFNPSYQGLEFQAVTPVPALGISGYNGSAFVLGHAIWSISVPIAIVEALTPARRAEPWLGRFGLAVTFGLYLLGCWVIHADLRESEGFMASPAQVTGAAAVAVLLICIAFACRKRPTRVTPRDSRIADYLPGPWLLGVTAFVVSSVLFARPESWLGVAMGVVMVAAVWPILANWSRHRDWTPVHEFAVAGGLLLTYAWAGFVLTLLLEPDDDVRWIGNAIFAVSAVLLVAVTAVLVRHRYPAAAASGDRVVQ